jgi:hypothetical protein
VFATQCSNEEVDVEFSPDANTSQLTGRVQPTINPENRQVYAVEKEPAALVARSYDAIWSFSDVPRADDKFIKALRTNKPRSLRLLERRPRSSRLHFVNTMRHP